MTDPVQDLQINYTPFDSVDIGAAPNDGSGDPLRDGGAKLNLNDSTKVQYLQSIAARPATAAAGIAHGQAITLSLTGQATLADASIAANSVVAGLAMNTVLAGQDVFYVSAGSINKSDWSQVVGGVSLNPGALYYLSAAIPGNLTTDPDESDTFFVTPVGFARSAQILDLILQQPVQVLLN